MDILEIILIGIGLSMDAAAVSLCKGLSACHIRPQESVLVGLYFGGFQALMPVVGYLLGSAFDVYIQRYSHWVSFILLLLIGANMLRESFGEEEYCDASFRVRSLLPLAVATSIDAMVIGVHFEAESYTVAQLLISVAIIGVITLTISAVAVWLGTVVGCRYNRVAQRFGGSILIVLGFKVLLEGLGILKL